MRLKPYVEPDLQGWLHKFQFSIPIKARYFETDMFGHVNNISYFIYFEQGRVEYLESLGLADRLFNDITASVVGDLECHYLAQVYKKEPLKLLIRTAKLGRSSFDLEYALLEAQTGQLKATGRGAMVFIDKQLGTSIPLPDDIRQTFLSFEGPNLML